VLAVGVGTGLVAYYVGLPGGLIGRDGPAELQYVPRDAAVVAYADVREIMLSDVRQKLRRVVPSGAPGGTDGQRQFREQTGIDIESDIDHVVASLQPRPDGKMAGLVVARGRFSDVKIEALMRQHGGQVADYAGKRVIVYRPADNAQQKVGDGVALSFLEPGLVAFGTEQMLRAAIDLQKSGGNVTQNDEIMNLMGSLEPGNAWAIGRVDALLSDGRLPAQFASQLPAITWFSVSGRVDHDIRGILRADSRDDEAANNLRDVVRGFLALGKLQAGSRPEVQRMMQSLELGGTGKSVVLSFSVPGTVLDAFGSRGQEAEPPPGR
jgi:hypothetical protein